MAHEPLTYLIYEDVYFISVDIMRTISKLRPRFRLAGIIEEENGVIETVSSKRVDFIIADVDVDDGRIINIIGSAYPKMPIILISGDSEYATFADGLNVMAFLLKPVTPEALEIALPDDNGDRKAIFPTRAVGIYGKRF